MHNWKNERLAQGAHWRKDTHKAEVLSRDLVTISCSQKKIPSGVTSQLPGMAQDALRPFGTSTIVDRRMEKRDCGENAHNLKHIKATLIQKVIW